MAKKIVFALILIATYSCEPRFGREDDIDEIEDAIEDADNNGNDTGVTINYDGEYRGEAIFFDGTHKRDVLFVIKNNFGLSSATGFEYKTGKIKHCMTGRTGDIGPVLEGYLYSDGTGAGTWHYSSSSESLGTWSVKR